MKKNKFKAIFILFFLAYALNAGFAAEVMTIAGTGDSLDLLKLLSFEFMRSNPDVTIVIPDSVGSGGGIKAVFDGSVELGRIARDINEVEKKYNLNSVTFADSPVVFTVNFSGKGIDNITYKEIVDIYSGKTAFWNELGGASRKIYVANREDGDSSRLILAKMIAGFKDISSFAGKILFSTQEAAGVIAKYQDTIGYVPYSAALERNLNILKVNGIYPSAESVKNKSYNLVAPFGIVWKGELKGKRKEFVDFLFSPAAREIIIKHGAFPAGR